MMRIVHGAFYWNRLMSGATLGITILLAARTREITANNLSTARHNVNMHRLGKQFWIRLQLAAGACSGPGTLLRMTDAGGRTAVQLDVIAQNASPGNALQLQIFTDFRPNP